MRKRLFSNRRSGAVVDSAEIAKQEKAAGIECEPHSSPLMENEENSEPVVEGCEKPERDM